MSNAPLFQRFVQDELVLAPALVSRVFAGTMQLLGGSRDGTQSAGDRGHHADIVRALQRDQALYERTFVDSLSKHVSDELNGHSDSVFADGRSGLGSLELMDESRVEVDIELSRAMQLIDTTAEWELRELQTFTSTLTGQRHVRAESNPFRPLVHASALWDAACAVVSAQVQRAIILRTSAGVAAGLLKNAWAAAATRLESQGVQPGLYRTVVLPSAASFGRLASPEPARNEGLSALLSSMPDGARGEDRGREERESAETPPRSQAGVRSDGGHRQSPELEQALLRLDELLRNLPSEASMTGRPATSGARIEQHRAALVASATEPIDRQTIEPVTRLFEALLADSQMQAGFRPVFARMQIAVLRATLTDHTVLDSYDHPIWHLLD